MSAPGEPVPLLPGEDAAGAAVPGGLPGTAPEPAVALPGPADGGEVGASSSRLAMAVRTILENKPAVASIIVLVLVVLFSFAGPLVYHTNQVSVNLLLENHPPSAAHLLGTSPTGRDELGRLMLGGQSTIVVGLAVGVFATLFGLVYGALAGFVGGVADAVLMRIVDALLSIPFLFFVVLLASLVTPNLLLIIAVITAVSWLSTARLARGETLTLRTLDYVAAARAAGSRPGRMLWRHITPNLLGVVVVNGTLKVADAILVFASISFLGLGIPPPATNWGTMLTSGVNNLFDGYWWQLWPAAFMIVVTVMAVNVLGDALHDVVEVRLRRR